MPSSVIAGFSYNADDQLLTITFVSGSVYQYQMVPAELFEAFRSSFAKGVFYNQQIKGKFAHRKL